MSDDMNAEPGAPAATAEERVVPLSGMKGMIAQKMVESLSQGAQLTHHASCDVSNLMRRKELLAEQGIKISVEDALIDAVITTLKSHPGMNGYVTQKEITVLPQMNIGVAVALPGDLLVAPAMLNADAMSLSDRALARKDLIARAKTNKLSVTEMTKGTFTISNLGLSRVQHFTPILPAPQIGMLGIGEIRRQYWDSESGELEIRPIMGLSLTFDHRAVNGGPAAEFLSDLCRTIEQATV